MIREIKATDWKEYVTTPQVVGVPPIARLYGTTRADVYPRGLGLVSLSAYPTDQPVQFMFVASSAIPMKVVARLAHGDGSSLAIGEMTIKEQKQYFTEPKILKPGFTSLLLLQYEQRSDYIEIAKSYLGTESEFRQLLSPGVGWLLPVAIIAGIVLLLRRRRK